MGSEFPEGDGTRESELPSQCNQSTFFILLFSKFVYFTFGPGKARRKFAAVEVVAEVS